MKTKKIIYIFCRIKIFFNFGDSNFKTQNKFPMKKLILVIAVLLVSKTNWALNPSREYKTMPAEYGMTFEEKVIETADKVRLKAWFFKPAAESRKLMVISDDGVGNMADNLELVAQFLSLGYNVLTYDYRGYGQSDDFTINPDFFVYPQFSQDILAVIDYTRKRHVTLELNLYGIGIGAALSIGAGANKTEVRRVIADAPYISLETMKKKITEKEGKDVKMPLVYDKYYLEPLYAMGEKGKHLYGVMYIVGETDPLIGPDDIKPLVKANTGKSSVYKVPGVDNSQNFSSNKNDYFNQIKKFLDKTK